MIWRLKSLSMKKRLCFIYCGVNSYSTSFIISPDGEFLAYANGALSLDGFNQFFDYSMSLYEKTDSGAEERIIFVSFAW